MCQEVAGASVFGKVELFEGRREASASIDMLRVYVDACSRLRDQS